MYPAWTQHVPGITYCICLLCSFLCSVCIHCDAPRNRQNASRDMPVPTQANMYDQSYQMLVLAANIYGYKGYKFWWGIAKYWASFLDAAFKNYVRFSQSPVVFEIPNWLQRSSSYNLVREYKLDEAEVVNEVCFTFI